MSSGAVVWVGNECTVNVYILDDQGFPTTGDGSPIFAYCYYQDCTVRMSLGSSRRAVTGRPHKKIVNDDYEYEMSVGYFYVKKSRELDFDTVFDGRRPLLVDMVLQHPYEAPAEAEKHRLKYAYATSISITSRDNENVTGSIEFSSEEFQ